MINITRGGDGMRKLGTIDLEILNLAIKENGTFNENNLENSNLKRLGVGRILDALASLKDRKFLLLNDDGSFSITNVAKEILWSKNIPEWAKVLRLLQIKSCNINEIRDILNISEINLLENIEKLRRNQFVLMSPQRQNDKVVKIYEILPAGIKKIDSTDTEGFNQIETKETGTGTEIISMLDDLKKEIQYSKLDDFKKDEIINKIVKIRERLEI